MDTQKSDFDAIFESLLRKTPPSDHKPKESRASSASDLLKSLFGNETSDDVKDGTKTTEGYGHDVIQALFGATKRLNLDDLNYWNLYPEQIKKWLLFTKSSKGYYDVTGQWVSITALSDLMNTYSTRDKPADLERWEDLYAKEQTALPVDLRGRFRFGVSHEEIKEFHPKLRRLFSFTFATDGEKLKIRKALAIDKWKSHDMDTASPAIQVDILTQRIRSLEKHIQSNKKDQQNRRALTMLVRRRRGLMTYLKKRDAAVYYAVLTNIGLRDLYELYPEKRISKLPTKYRK
jgi:small subunit ribosomal protein S15